MKYILILSGCYYFTGRLLNRLQPVIYCLPILGAGLKSGFVNVYSLKDLRNAVIVIYSKKTCIPLYK